MGYAVPDASRSFEMTAGAPENKGFPASRATMFPDRRLPGDTASLANG
jgi:hypothetical protein